jgi:hypothetical protein
VLQILAAHRQVNATRLAHVAALLETPDDSPARARPSWAVLVSTLASKDGVPARAYVRDRSLAGLMAQAHLHAGAQRDAMAEAKRTAGRE